MTNNDTAHSVGRVTLSTDSTRHVDSAASSAAAALPC
jgi:hypothetical protein